MTQMNLDDFLEKTYNFATTEWLDARKWVTRKLRDVATTENGYVTYSELCDELHDAGMIALQPHATPLAGLLGQINVLEHRDGRPLISAVVVNKTGFEPGVGFWNIARELGFEIEDNDTAREAFWLETVRKSREYWARRKASV